MAIDNSVVKIPSLSTTSGVEKVDLQGVGGQVTFNNGVYLSQESLNKSLPKSLYKVWSNNNKLYLLERETTKIESIINSISSKTNRVFKIGGSDDSFAFVNETNEQLAEKSLNSLRLVENTRFNNSPETINNSLSNYRSYTKESIALNHNNYKNKIINFYKLKPELTTNLLKLCTPQEGLTEILNSNFFLRIKSIFTTREISSSYYNYFTYLLAHWALFKVDEVTLSEFDSKKRSDTVKATVSAPLKEQDLDLFRSLSITNTKRLSYSFDNLRKIDNVLVFDTSDVNGIRTLSITDSDGYTLLDQDNYTNYYNKVFVFENLNSGQLSAINSIEFYTVGDIKRTAFSYNFESLYNSLGGSMLDLGVWSADRQQRLENKKSNYRLLIYDKQDYVGIPVEFGNSLIELETNTEFRTNSDGDFYVVEIV